MNISRLLFRMFLGRRLPITSGTLTVPGVTQSVLIRRDAHGIPYIEAEDEEDGWYGVGFCQGQDRAFQLEVLRRVARGTLSELIGPTGLPIDRLSRRIGFLHSAGPQLEAFYPDIRTIIDAFARGVTYGSMVGCRRVPHEFSMLRTKPSPFTAQDVVAIYLLQSFVLASNWDIELARLHILNEDGPEALAAVDPAYPEWQPVSASPGVPAGPAADRLAEDLEEFAKTVGHGGASNNWAIAPSRTAAGRPILASDPHLAPLLPPPWYLAHLRTPDWTVAGATFVGMPAFPYGHNGFAAWGATAGLADNTDLFIEEAGPDGRSVREGDEFVPCDTRREEIYVKGEGEVVEEVMITPRGPIIGPALKGNEGAISLRAMWLDPLPVKGFLTAHRARSFEEFRRAFEEWPHISLNLAYADSTGTIAYQLIGQLPRRRKGWGTIPIAGWDPDAGWEETLVPFEDMPYAVDPPDGAVATANNQPTSAAVGPFLGMDWLDGYRVSRILESLEERDDWDIGRTLALQVDQLSLPWRELRDLVLDAPVQSDDSREALALLDGWDGVVAADSPAASVFELFVAEISRHVAGAKAPRSWQWALGKGVSPLHPLTLLSARRIGHLVRLLRDQPEGWSDTPWAQVIEESLAAAVSALREGYGDKRKRWAWGRIRTLTLHHPAGTRSFFGRVFNLGPFPWGGDANTVSQAAPDLSDPTTNPLAIATLRMAVDVGNWEENRFSLAGGQSGNPVSPHYDDLLRLWRRGDGVPIAWSPDQVGATARSTLRLLPVDAAST